jgi:hypothetical protein
LHHVVVARVVACHDLIVPADEGRHVSNRLQKAVGARLGFVKTVVASEHAQEPTEPPWPALRI